MGFLFQRTGAALTMSATTAVKSILFTMAVGRVRFLFLVAALAFDVGCPRLA